MELHAKMLVRQLIANWQIAGSKEKNDSLVSVTYNNVSCVRSEMLTQVWTHELAANIQRTMPHRPGLLCMLNVQHLHTRFITHLTKRHWSLGVQYYVESKESCL